MDEVIDRLDAELADPNWLAIIFHSVQHPLASEHPAGDRIPADQVVQLALALPTDCPMSRRAMPVAAH